MAIRTNVSRYFSLRRILIQIHMDLFKVERRIRYDRWPEPLSDFEILVLILEDRRFFKHYGIDVKSLIREIVRALTLHRFGGASTIDMQFVRTATNYRYSTRCAGSCMRCFSHGSFNTDTINLKFCGRILPAPSMAPISLASTPPPKRYSAFRNMSCLSISLQNLPRCWFTHVL